MCRISKKSQGFCESSRVGFIYMLAMGAKQLEGKDNWLQL